MYLPERGVGVATVSVSNAAWLSDPWMAKTSRWASWEYWQEVFREFDLLNAAKVSSERIYVFLAVRVDAPDLSAYCHDQAPSLASWFTGGYEHESLERKHSLVGSHNNISHRNYERLFMRWTDALALYNLDTAAKVARNDIRPGEALPSDLDDYRLAHCRAAQLFAPDPPAMRHDRTFARVAMHGYAVASHAHGRTEPPVSPKPPETPDGSEGRALSALRAS
jgi:hypothetical protein